MKTEKELIKGCGEKNHTIEICGENLKQDYFGAKKGDFYLCPFCKAKLKTLQERNTEVKQVIRDEIKYFEKPETELNKAIIFYLITLLQKLGLDVKEGGDETDEN